MLFLGVITIVAALLLIPWGESQVSLSRTSPPGTSSVCPDATAVFTCRVTGFILVWTSPEYIGQNPVEITAYDTIGEIVNINDDVVVSLTQNSDGMLESELHVRVNSNSSIRCLPGHAMSGKTVNLTVYNISTDFRGRVMNVSAETVEKAPTCTIHVEWDPPNDKSPEDIHSYIIRDSENRVLNKTNATSALVTVPLICECTDNLTISITTVDRCGVEGPTSDSVELKCLPSTNPATDTSTPSGTLSTTTTNTPNGIAQTSPAVIAGIGLFIGLIVAVLVVVGVILLYRTYCRRPEGEKRRVGADSDARTENETVSSGPPPPPRPVQYAGLEIDGVMLRRRGLKSPRVNF